MARSRACLPRQRCATIHRKREASIRNALRGLLFQIVNQTYEGIEADDLGAVGDEVGEGINVIEVELAITVVNDVLDAADFDIGGLHDALDVVDGFVRRSVAFHANAVLGCINGAGGASKFLSAGGPAYVGRAEIKCFAGEVDLDPVKELATDYFDAHDVSATGRNKLLHQGGVVEAKIDGGAVGFDGGLEIVKRVELGDACAAATNVRLDHDGEAETFGGGNCVSRAVDHARLGIRQAQGFKK